MEEFSSAESKKIFRGAYEYYKDDHIYSEESFEVIRHIKELTNEFVSESLSRLSTGELLKINTSYTVGKNWIPRMVVIKKSLGRHSVEETFNYNVRKNEILYTFTNISRKSKDEYRMTTPPRFHIGTPTTASSFLFLLSKKFNTTERNDYSVVVSENQWEYREPLKTKNISIEKTSSGEESITVAGKQLLGSRYVLYGTPDELNPAMREKFAGPFVQVFVSKHLSIPYLIQDPEGIKIQVKFLQNLEEY